MKAQISLIVGLGNPGPQYEQTRHNVGFWLMNKFAEKHDVAFKMESKFKGFTASLVVQNHDLKLLLPQTFMNLSGQSVVAFAHFYKIPPEEILVVHDELDFSPGVVRFKKGGSSGGHNGIQNIIELLGDNNFYRLRIGIGKPINKDTLVDYVISKPSRYDTEKIIEAIDDALKVLPKFIMGDIGRATEELHLMN